MGIARFFRRLWAQHETRPSAVCGRPHVAVPSSDHLVSAGGGPLPAPDISCVCVPITPDYVQDVVSLETEEDLVESVGLRFDELAALSQEDMHALAREKPLEIIGLLQTHGFAHLTFSLFPAAVTITVFGRAFGIDPAPFLALDPDEGLAAFRERIYGSVAFIADMPAEKRSAVLSAAFCSGNFRSAVREVADVDPPFMQ